MTKHARSRKPARASASADRDEIATPSLITPLHKKDRVLKHYAGSPSAWRKMTQLEHAYQQERLGAKGSKAAYRRLCAGNQYTELWDCAQTAGRDSTANFDLGRSMGSGTPLSEAQRDAIRDLVTIEMRLGRNDRTIIRSVCGTGHSPSDAMKLAGLCTDTHTTARLCEALDTLADVCERMHRNKKRN